MKYKYLRFTKGLPQTALILKECPSMSGEPGYLVKVFGFTKESFWLASDCKPYTPDNFMQNLLNDWQKRIGL